MPVGVRVITALLVLTGAAAAASGQFTQVVQATRADPSQDVAIQGEAPARDRTTAVPAPRGATDPNGFRRPTGAVDASPLNAKECHDLGGKVRVDGVGICRTGYFCERVDNKGKKHAVCLSTAE